MDENERVRSAVARSYGKAVSNRSGGGCCSESTASYTPQVQKGEAVKVAGYSESELAVLPTDAVVHSFGCGNPVAFSGVKEGDIVVDLGCGAGIDLLIAARKVGVGGRVIGVDMTDEMLAKARENIAASGLMNIKVRKGTIEELPVESSMVDWVISNCVINLSPEKPKVFSEIARVLKPGGQMLVSDIVVEDLPEWVLANKALYSSCVGGAIAEADYLSGLRQAGLVDVKVRERITYEPSQLKALFQSDLTISDEVVADWAESLDEQAVNEMVESLAGRICSATIYGRKACSRE